MNRRDLLLSVGAAATVGSATPAVDAATAPKDVLPIEQFQPRSMLHATETKVSRAAFPVLDMHTHITHAGV